MGSKVTKNSVKESLEKQLQIKGANVDLYKSLISDYMWFWKQEKEMQADICKRGRTYLSTSSTGKEYEKSNPSVKDALLYSKQMVSILDALGLDTENVKSGIQEDDNPDDL